MGVNLKIKIINNNYKFSYFHVEYKYFRCDSIILKRIVSFLRSKLGSRSNLSIFNFPVKAVNANEKIDIETGPQNDVYSSKDCCDSKSFGCNGRTIILMYLRYNLPCRPSHKKQDSYRKLGDDLKYIQNKINEDCNLVYFDGTKEETK